jgi:phage-related protein
MASVGTESVEVVPDARGFKEKLDAQLRALALEVRIRLDTTEATAKLDELKLRLDDVRGGRIRIIADTADAEAKIAALKAELDSLRDKKVNIDDGGSAANTSSKISAIAGAASFAQAGVALKVTGIITALAAIIPIAAAATAAVAGIGLVLGIGVLGALVGKLALGGVGSAVSAGSTPGGGGVTAQQQAQNVNAQRQAQVALTVANRDAAQAQKDLTQARIDADNTLQSLSNAVTDNALAQRQAAIDVANAGLALRTAQASPDAANPQNATALAQVQLAFDQAKQHQIELAQAGEQAAQVNAKAQALGVNGAQNVINAQNKVVDTQNAVVQAHFQVANAALTAANATSAFGQALKKLDPAQQAFTRFLLSVKPLFDQLKTAAADSFLPLLEQAIKDFLPALTPLTALLSTVGTGFGKLADEAAKFFASPVFTQFVLFLDSVVGPALADFGKIFGNLFTAGIAGFEKIAPLLLQLGGIFAQLSGDLAKAFQGGALDGFIATVQANLPQIGATLSAVFGAISSLLSALAPAAGPALEIIQQLANGLKQIFPVLGPLVTLFLSLVNTALKPLIPQLVQVVRQLFPPLVLLIEAIVPVAGQLVSGFLDLVSALTPLLPVIAELIATLLPPLIAFLDQLITQGIAPLAQGLLQSLGPILPQIAVSFSQILTALTPLIPLFTKALVDAIAAMAPQLPGLAKAFADLVTAFANFVAQVPPSFFTALIQVMNVLSNPVAIGLIIVLAKTVTDIVNGLDDLVNGNFPKTLEPLYTAFYNIYIYAIKPIVDGLKDIKNFGGDLLSKGASFVTGGLIGHAKGGPVAAGVPGIVGEEGPELFVPTANGQIITNKDTQKLLAGSSSGTTINVWEAFDARATAATVNRHLQFAGV